MAGIIPIGWTRLMDGTLKSPQFKDELGNYVTKFIKTDGRRITRTVDDTVYHRATTTSFNPKSGCCITREYGQKSNYLRVGKFYPGELPSNREILVNNKTGQVERIEINNPHNHILYDYPNNTLWTRENCWESYHTNGCSAGTAPVSAAEAIRALHLI